MSTRDVNGGYRGFFKNADGTDGPGMVGFRGAGKPRPTGPARVYAGPMMMTGPGTPEGAMRFVVPAGEWDKYWGCGVVVVALDGAEFVITRRDRAAQKIDLMPMAAYRGYFG